MNACHLFIHYSQSEKPEKMLMNNKKNVLTFPLFFCFLLRIYKEKKSKIKQAIRCSAVPFSNLSTSRTTCFNKVRNHCLCFQKVKHLVSTFTRIRRIKN